MTRDGCPRRASVRARATPLNWFALAPGPKLHRGFVARACRSAPARWQKSVLPSRGRHLEMAAMASARSKQHKRRSSCPWWTVRLADAVDPITLEPLRILTYPPFRLPADPSLPYQTDSDFFDPCSLSSYLVSRLNFSHPFSRRLLEREECVSLDRHLAQNGLPAAGVALAFDEQDERRAAQADARGAASSAAERQDQAASLRASLFSGESVTASSGRSGRRRGAAAEARARAAAAAASVALAEDGNIAVYDDDLLPGHAPNRAAAAAAASSVAFPALPTPAPPPPESAVARAHRESRQAAAEAVARAEDAAAVAADTQQQSLEIAEEEGGEEGREDCGAREELAEFCRRTYSTAAIAAAREDAGLVCEIERELELLLAGGERRRALRAMPRAHRRLVHELSHVYRVGTLARGTEPSRCVHIVRNDVSDRPRCSLTRAAGLLASERGAASGGAAAGGDGPSARAWQLRLTHVQCDEATLSSTLRSFAGEYSVAWSPERRSERRTAREAMRCEAMLTFSREAVARQALHSLGGGRRGAFRVATPAWAAVGEAEVAVEMLVVGGGVDGEVGSEGDAEEMPPPPADATEEEQLQWALNASERSLRREMRNSGALSEAVVRLSLRVRRGGAESGANRRSSEGDAHLRAPRYQQQRARHAAANRLADDTTAGTGPARVTAGPNRWSLLVDSTCD